MLLWRHVSTKSSGYYTLTRDTQTLDLITLNRTWTRPDPGFRLCLNNLPLCINNDRDFPKIKQTLGQHVVTKWLNFQLVERAELIKVLYGYSQHSPHHISNTVVSKRFKYQKCKEMTLMSQLVCLKDEANVIPYFPYCLLHLTIPHGPHPYCGYQPLTIGSY